MSNITGHTITGGSGTQIYIETMGNPANPAVIYLHGYAQSRLAWRHQFTPEMAESIFQVRVDMRGHGNSEKPEGLELYQDGKNWADDVQAIITTLGLQKPVLAGSSYGGLVITNYLEHYGQDHIGGLIYVGAGTETGSREAGALLGAEFMELGAPMLSGDMAVAIPAIKRYIEISTQTPLPQDELFMFMGFNAIVPLHVRQGMLMRQFSSDEVLRTVKLPVMIIHGAEDRVVLPGFADFIVERIPHADKRLYADCGHFPFIEFAAQFNADVAGFVTGVSSK